MPRLARTEDRAVATRGRSPRPAAVITHPAVGMDVSRGAPAAAPGSSLGARRTQAPAPKTRGDGGRRLSSSVGERRGIG